MSQKFRTPYVSILAFALGMFLLALLGTFQGNAVLSAVARLVTYGVVCACLITLRRQQPLANAFRLPAGALISAMALVFVLALITQMGLKELFAIVGVIAVALLNWTWAKVTPHSVQQDSSTRFRRDRRSPTRTSWMPWKK